MNEKKLQFSSAGNSPTQGKKADLAKFGANGKNIKPVLHQAQNGFGILDNEILKNAMKNDLDKSVDSGNDTFHTISTNGAENHGK